MKTVVAVAMRYTLYFRLGKRSDLIVSMSAEVESLEAAITHGKSIENRTQDLLSSELEWVDGRVEFIGAVEEW